MPNSLGFCAAFHKHTHATEPQFANMVRVQRKDTNGPIVVDLIVLHADRLRTLDSEEAMRDAVTRRATRADEQHRHVIGAETSLQSIADAIQNKFGPDAFVFSPQTHSGTDWQRPIGQTPALFVTNRDRPVYVFAVDTVQPQSVAQSDVVVGDVVGDVALGEVVGVSAEQQRVVVMSEEQEPSDAASVASVVVTTFAPTVGAKAVAPVAPTPAVIEMPQINAVPEADIAEMIRKAESSYQAQGVDAGKEDVSVENQVVAEEAEADGDVQQVLESLGVSDDIPNKKQTSMFGPAWQAWWLPK